MDSIKHQAVDIGCLLYTLIKTNMSIEKTMGTFIFPIFIFFKGVPLVFDSFRGNGYRSSPGMTTKFHWAIFVSVVISVLKLMNFDLLFFTQPEESPTEKHKFNNQACCLLKFSFNGLQFMINLFNLLLFVIC